MLRPRGSVLADWDEEAEVAAAAAAAEAEIEIEGILRNRKNYAVTAS